MKFVLKVWAGNRVRWSDSPQALKDAVSEAQALYDSNSASIVEIFTEDRARKAGHLGLPGEGLHLNPGFDLDK